MGDGKQRQWIAMDFISKHNYVHVKAAEEVDFDSPQLRGLV